MYLQMRSIVREVLVEAGRKSDSEKDRQTVKKISDEGITEPLAYAYILVELANCDSKFDFRERRIIETFLSETFTLSRQGSNELITTAQGMLHIFRGRSSCIDKIRQEYSYEERQKLYDVIDRIVSADGSTDPYEAFFQMRLKELLA